jgi:hypothetical protein
MTLTITKIRITSSSIVSIAPKMIPAIATPAPPRPIVFALSLAEKPRKIATGPRMPAQRKIPTMPQTRDQTAMASMPPGALTPLVDCWGTNCGFWNPGWPGPLGGAFHGWGPEGAPGAFQPPGAGGGDCDGGFHWSWPPLGG